MAFKNKSRKRTKSMTNLLDTTASSGNQSEQSPNPEGLADDYESNLAENTYSNLNLTPQKKNKLRGRNFSQTCLLQPNSIINSEKYKMDEPIPETVEEDDATQMSECRPPDQLENISKLQDQLNN